MPKELGRATMPVVLPGEDAAWQIWLHGGWDSARRRLENDKVRLVERLTENRS